MTTTPGFLRLNRLRIIGRGKVAYDESFHTGVNIIRGQNGSGKSTLADFIFFILGGEFADWKDAASHCDEAQAEIETPRGKLTLKRQIAGAQEPMSVYFGSMEDASKSSLEGWERFPIRRQGNLESFSQVMFRSLQIPEAKSDGAANITMHQLLRLCYSDQRTPATRLFRFEQFDTQNIREAVGDLVCGISGYEVYEIGLKLRELNKQLSDVEMRLKGLSDALPSDRAFNTPKLIQTEIGNLQKEKTELQQEVSNVDKFVEPGGVKKYLIERSAAQKLLSKQQDELKTLELRKKTIEFEVREINEFMIFLDELMEKLIFAEATFGAVGSIEFTHCPACGEQLEPDIEKEQCVVCRSPIDQERESARYNQIRLDLEIQKRESNQLIRQKESELVTVRQYLRRLKRNHEKDLSAFDLKYAGGNGPREAFLATRTNRLGHIEAQIDFLTSSLELAEEIATLISQKAAFTANIEVLKTRNQSLHREAEKRRTIALSRISNIGAELLRSDLKRQPEFIEAENVCVNFQNDSISVGSSVNFAESSNVYLRNTAVLGLFLAANMDFQFYHPRFLLLDNVEDKGMEEVRSHLFQRLIVEKVAELESPHQVIFTTSMMNPVLELDDYTIGPPYTSEKRSLNLEWLEPSRM